MGLTNRWEVCLGEREKCSLKNDWRWEVETPATHHSILCLS